MNSGSDVQETKKTVTDMVLRKGVRRRLDVKKRKVHAGASRAPTYFYLQRRKAAARRRNYQKKLAAQVKQEWDIIKKQEKRSRVLEERLKNLLRENDRLILRIIDELSLPDQDPEVIKGVKEKLKQLHKF